MEKISLETSVMRWYEQACEKYGARVSPELESRVRGLLYSAPFIQANPTMRSLCVSALSDFIDHKWRCVCILFYLLGKYGLRIEMSKEEMDEYEGKAVPKADAIDWEQRRWELASGIHMRVQHDPIVSIRMADALIEQYKKSLNTEE